MNNHFLYLLYPKSAFSTTTFYWLIIEKEPWNLSTALHSIIILITGFLFQLQSSLMQQVLHQEVYRIPLS